MTTTTFDTTTRTLSDELDRLAAKADDLEAEREATDDPDAIRRLNRELDDVDQEGRAVDWLINGDDPDDIPEEIDPFEGYGPEATVTVRGLGTGEYAEVENRSADARAKATAEGGVPGTGKLIFAAAGLVDAPFYDGEPEDVDAKVEALANQPIGVRKWVEDLVSDLTVRGSGNWRDSAGRSGDKNSGD